MEKFLKYGDYIMLYSPDDKFLMARSIQESDVYFLQSP